MELRKVASAVFDRLVNVFVFVASALVVFTVLSVLSDVVLRYFFNRPQSWVLESTEWSLFLITFLVAAWLLKKEGHVNIDVVIVHLSPRTQSLFGMITSLFGAAICFVILWYGVQTIIDHLQRSVLASTLVPVPKAVFLAMIPMSMFLLLIQFLKRAYSFAVNWRTLANKGKDFVEP